MTDHEAKAKALVAAWETAHGISRWIMAFAMSDLENRIAAALRCNSAEIKREIDKAKK